VTARKKKPAKDPLAALRKKYPGEFAYLPFSGRRAGGNHSVYIGGRWVMACEDILVARAICKIGE
jgi:hypothetical protein